MGIPILSCHIHGKQVIWNLISGCSLQCHLVPHRSSLAEHQPLKNHPSAVAAASPWLLTVFNWKHINHLKSIQVQWRLPRW